MVVCFSRQSLLHSSPPTPLCAFFSSVSNSPFQHSLSPHRKSLFWFRFWFFLPEFFPGDKLFIMPTLVVFFFWLIWVFVFFPNSKRSLDSGARC